jgi:PAS domain S-box-containing protein
MQRTPSNPGAGEQNFRTFFEMSGVGNVVADAKTQLFTRANEKFCEITGYSSEELTSKTAADITHPDDRERDAAGWANFLESGEEHFHIEKRYVRKDGSTVWVSVTSTIIRDDAGNPLRSIGVVSDITDRQSAVKALEQTRNDLERHVSKRTSELEAANRTLATLVAASPLAIAAVDAQGDVTIWNAAAEQLFDVAEREALGRPLLKLASTDELKQRLRLAMGSRGTMQIDASWERKNGSRFDASIWVTPLSPSEGGHLLMMNDITEKKFLERALLEASEREQRRIGQELHDSLCQHLLGAAFAAKALAGSLQNEGSRSAPQLDDLARLINDAVTQARDISRGLHPVELDSAGLMSALQELAARASHSIPCTFRCERSVFVTDSTAALHAYRIIQEAVATATQGTASKISIHLYEKDDLVCLEVFDDGKTENELTAELDGMPARIMAYRANAIGGKLDREFAPGKGTTISCCFPREKKR